MQAVEKIGYFKPQELATFAWAFARVSHKAPELFLALEGQLLKALSAGSLKTADLSMAVWAFASAGCGSPQLFRSLGSAAAKAAREGRFAGREVSALLWGLATAGHGASEEVLQAFEGRLGGPEGIDLATLRSREVANILWAYAELGMWRCPLPPPLPLLPASVIRQPPHASSTFLSCHCLQGMPAD